MVGGAIAIDPSCCCSDCESCLTIDSVGYTEDEMLMAVHITAATLTPTYVCDGQTGTLAVSITNNVGEFLGGCFSPTDLACATRFDFYSQVGVIEITNSNGGTVTSSSGTVTVIWYDESFEIGETKVYEVEFTMLGCTTGLLEVETIHSEGYRGGLFFSCVPCSEVPA